MARVAPKNRPAEKICVALHAHCFLCHSPPAADLFSSPAGIPANAMEARAAKRLASIQHVRQKVYYTDEIEEPDPLDNEISTRHWKCVFNLWVQAMKEAHRSATQRSWGGA